MTGWALFVGGQLDSFGQIDGHSETSSPPPYDLVDKTAHAARRTYERVVSSRPDAVVLEETNIGGRSGQRSQKFLEWEHLALLQLLEQVPGRASVSYLQSQVLPLQELLGALPGADTDVGFFQHHGIGPGGDNALVGSPRGVSRLVDEVVRGK
jgi:hypothetical protein